MYRQFLNSKAGYFELLNFALNVSIFIKMLISPNIIPVTIPTKSPFRKTLVIDALLKYSTSNKSRTITKTEIGMLKISAVLK